MSVQSNFPNVQVSISGPQQPVSVGTSGPQQPISVGISPGIGPSVVVTDSATSVVGIAGVNPFQAGKNISITTTGGSITIVGDDPPVLSVQGRTGNVVLSLGELGGVPLGTQTPQSLGNATAGVSTAASRQDHVHPLPNAAAIPGFASEASKYGPVTSINGLTGTPVIVGVGNVTVSLSSSTISIAATNPSRTLLHLLR